MNALFVAWRPENPAFGWRPVGRLEHEEGLYRFSYTRGATQDGFRPFAGMGNLQQVYESEQLFPLFANRLLSKSRPEYESYLQWSGFETDSAPDPLMILGVTEGLRQTDAIEVFPCPQPDADGCFRSKFFVHGIRWMHAKSVEAIALLAPRTQLFLMPDVQNTFDPNAVALRTADNHRLMVGYVPRYLAGDVQQLISDCGSENIDLQVDRVNPEAPLQNRLLCRLRACWPAGFRPCAGDEFQPLAEVSTVAVAS